MPLPYDPVFDAIRNYLGYVDITTRSLVPGAWDFTVAPLVYENEGDGPPAGPLAPWVLVVLDSHMYGLETIGADDGADNQNRADEDGLLWFHIFTPKGTGSREARRIAKGLSNLFRARRLLSDEGLEFMDSDMGAGEPGRERGNYYLMSVSIEWLWTEAD